MNKDVEYYMSLPYPIVMIQDKDKSWFVEIPLLKGCMSVGDDWNQALEMIRDAQRGWLAVAIEHGFDIPEPQREYA